MKKGRPRQFDESDAVEKAMRVFWKQGYEGASLSDLTDAMGISRPSLYAAFGDKMSLFLRTLDRYHDSPASYVARALDEPTAREVYQKLLFGVIDLVTDPASPGSCLFVCAGFPSRDPSDPVSRELATRRAQGERDIARRFRKALQEGDLPPDSDPNALAKLATTIMWGIAIQSTNGSRRSELQKIARMAIEAFPFSLSHTTPDSTPSRKLVR